MKKSWREWGKGLWVVGPKETSPEGSLRRARGLHKISPRSARSRWGTQLFSPLANIFSLFRFNNTRFAGALTVAGNTLVRFDDTGHFIVLKDSLPTSPFSFASLSPAGESAEQLFVAGGGELFKVDVDGVVTKWGIDPPTDGATIAVQDAPTRILDPLETVGSYIVQGDILGVGSGPTGNAIGHIFPEGIHTATDTASVNAIQLTYTPVNVAGIGVAYGVAQRDITLESTPSLDFSTIGGSASSSDSDFITFWVRTDHPELLYFIQLVFNSGDNPLLNNNAFAGSAVVQGNFVTPAGPVETTPGSAPIIPNTVGESGLTVFPSGSQQIIPATPGKWTHVRIAKKDFAQIGTPDWKAITAIQFLIARNPIPSGSPIGHVFIDDLRLESGPGTAGDYLLAYTYRNSLTGSRSNANPTRLFAPSVNRQAIKWTNFPFPTDPQVDQVEVWRTLGDQVDLFLVAQLNISTPQPNGDPPLTTLNQFIDQISDFAGASTPIATTGAGGVISNPAGSLTLLIGDSGDRAAIKVGAVIVNLTTGEQRTVTLLHAGFLTVDVDQPTSWTSTAFTYRNLEQIVQNIALPLDNFVPFPTFFEVVGFGGRAWWLSRGEGERGKVFYSPINRVEALGGDGTLAGGGFVRATEGDDAGQRLVVWNKGLWLFTEGRIFALEGPLEGPFRADSVLGAPGVAEVNRLTVTPTPIGIFYQATDGVRLFDGLQSRLVGFDALGLLFQGEDGENVTAFEGLHATSTHDEYLICDNDTILALNIEKGVWRDVGVMEVTALFNEAQTGETLIATSTGLSILEKEGVVLDDGQAIPFAIEVPSIELDEKTDAILQRLDIECNPADILNTLTITLIIQSDADVGDEVVVGTVSNFVGRFTKEFPLARYGRVIGVRIEGALVNGPVEVFGIDLYYTMPGEEKDQ